MVITVNKLPSNFKPYPFKSFKIKAISLQQALDLGKDPALSDVVKLLQELTNNEIDASLLVPIDVKYLLSMLAFHAFPNQSWKLNLVCPHCKHEHAKAVTMKDFPPIACLSDEDPYPLTIDDGTHKWEIGYATITKMEMLTDKSKLTKDSETGDIIYSGEYLDIVEPYILSVDGSAEGIRDALLGITDFGVLALILEAIKKYFVEDTYGEFPCPKCKKKYRVPLSAVEVTQYTPFLDKTAVSRYKTNFRL